jgi:hypothetical protein
MKIVLFGHHLGGFFKRFIQVNVQMLNEWFLRLPF